MDCGDFRYDCSEDAEGAVTFTRTLLNTAGAQPEVVDSNEVPEHIRNDLRRALYAGVGIKLSAQNQTA